MCGGMKFCDVFWYCISPFFSIFFFVSVCLSFLIFSQSLTTYPLLDQIYHPEAVTLFAPTRLEARHVFQESRADAIYLLQIKSLFPIPCFLLSLIAALHATALSYNGKVPNLQSTAKAVKQNWKHPSITTIFVYALLLALIPIQWMLVMIAPTSELRFIPMAVGTSLDVYLMAVLNLGLVVAPVVEGREEHEAKKK